jgi:two-component system NarL family sensor kinase
MEERLDPATLRISSQGVVPSPTPEAWPPEWGILPAIGDALNRSPDVRQALERTLALLAEHLGLQTGWIWLLDPETRQFYLAAAQNLPPFLLEPVRMCGPCLCNELFRTGKLSPSNVEMLECTRLSAGFGQVREGTLGLRFHASIPLYFQDEPLGIINVTGPSWRELDADELCLLSTIACHVGVAVERARLAEESSRLARAEERTRIAREIHDTLAQGLTAIGLDIEGALHQIEASPERARERLQRALLTARESLEEARRSVLDLRTAPLAGRPLAEALAALARQFTSDTGVRVHVKSRGDESLPLRIEADLYRIATEALTNVRKHAHASLVEVALQPSEHEIQLSIHDDGRGFDRREIRVSPRSWLARCGARAAPDRQRFASARCCAS